MHGKTIVVCFAILLESLSPASAQTAGTRVIVQVPFRFHAGQRAFAPGLYSLASEAGVLWLAEGNGLTKARMLANSLRGTSSASTGQVVFHCYRQECFLFQVWFPERDEGVQMLTSPIETDFQKRRETSVYMTLLGKEPQQ